MAPKSYTDYTTAQSVRNPCLRDLCQFLEVKFTRNIGRFVCVDIPCSDEALIIRELSIDGVKNLLDDRSTNIPSTKGRILIVEDLSSEIVELLGSRLDIDPVFFASHLHGQRVELNYPKPSLARLPSRVRKQNFVSLPYQRCLEFCNASPSLRRLSRDCNIPRKVMMLPPTKDVQIGLVQHCCSVLWAGIEEGPWLGIISVDPPTNNIYRSIDTEVALQTRLFQGGYEDFTNRASFFSHDQAGPSRHSLLQDLIHYWTAALPPSFTNTPASLLTLSYYPLQIIAAEWVRYIAVLSHNIKQYEYTYDPLVANVTTPSGLNYLDANLRNLQVWGRRCIQKLYKLDLVTNFLRNHTPSAAGNVEFKEYELLAEDYVHIRSQVQTYQHRLEALIPVVTSLVQIVDTRRSLKEAANVTRLT
ncbi:hypothetical protein EYC80_006864 [Monilinia laxa]|uniref:Uncharacterized protein n=1 Tax=Monilinia laxa TaxID=61186 RepID=A0A5N6JZD7_MONLA|nr:hypothetical protein EYC80_006864 [Monilinia laxa]